MKIQKYHYWLAFFFFIFGMTFSMIIWTVKSAVDTPVYDDKSFMTSYQDVDENYNNMVIANMKFNKQYNSVVTINDREVGMEFGDLLYGQRSLEKKSRNQNMLQVGENLLKLKIVDKNNLPVKSAKIEFQITRPIEDIYDINLDNFKFDGTKYIAKVKIDKAGNWNIIGKVTVGDDVGYLYIKTNTKK